MSVFSSLRGKDSGYFYTWSHFLFINSFTHIKKLSIMSTITLTPIEFDLFKNIATFYFDFTVKLGIVYVVANTDLLASLGY